MGMALSIPVWLAAGALFWIAYRKPAQAGMTPEARIAALIAAQGPISVAQFMTLALHDPEGRLLRHPRSVRRGGDFITAPEISQMFGEMLGLWLRAGLGTTRAAQKSAAGGTGARARHPDGRHPARRAGGAGIPADLEVVLVEASPALQEMQARKTARTAARRSAWQTHFDDSLADRPLFLLANEFFDALPVRQYVKTERGWCERMVMAQNGELAFALAPVPVPAVRHSRRAAPARPMAASMKPRPPPRRWPKTSPASSPHKAARR